MKKIFYPLIIVLVIVCTHLFINNMNESYALKTFEEKQKSMYVWSLDSIDYSSFDKVVDYLNIDTLYIGSYRDLNSYNNSLIFNFAKEKNLNSYMVYGEKIANLDDIKRLVDKVALYNSTHVYQITGLAIDSEFHTTEEYRNADAAGKEAMFRTYVDLMKEAYAYAKANNLKYVACIPVHYDSISESILEELIRDGSDYIQLMNYNKNGKITKIEKEVELAKKYNKEIESIAELLPPGHHDVTDAITFWNEGLDACTDSFREIDSHYNYDLMKYSYHYYNPVIDLAKNVLDLTNEYDLELYTKDMEGNTKEVSNIYLVNGEQKIKGFTTLNKASNEYITYFYGVSYDKEYEIVVENENYLYEVNSNTILFNKSEDRIKSEERLFTATDRPEEPVEEPQPEEPQPEEPAEEPLPEEQPEEQSPVDDEVTLDETTNTELGTGNVETTPEVDNTIANVEQPTNNTEVAVKEEAVNNNKPNTTTETSNDEENYKTPYSTPVKKEKVTKKMGNKKEKQKKQNTTSKKPLYIVLGVLSILVIILVIKKFNLISLKSR